MPETLIFENSVAILIYIYVCLEMLKRSYEVMRLAEACIPLNNNFVDAELFKPMSLKTL